jgi:imidazolonepropionase-like amidohydrolase
VTTSLVRQNAQLLFDLTGNTGADGPEQGGCRMKAIVGATLIDGLGSPSLPDAVVLIDSGAIVAAGHRGELAVPDDAEVLGLSGMTVLPGLIDTHIHLLGHRSMDTRGHEFVGEGLRAARCTAHLRALLDAGITTVRDCGSYTALALKQAVAEGSIPGPRILAVGRFVERTGGADDASWMPLEWAQRAGPWGPRMADGPAEVRKAVREQVRDGADWIKTCSTGAATTQPGSHPNVTEWSMEELTALIDEAHRLGKRVAVHAHASVGIRDAIVAGADTIEHGSGIDAECARMMVDRGLFLIPTFYIRHRIMTVGPEFGTPEWVVTRARASMAEKQRAFRIALEQGVRIAMGTDCGGQNLLPFGTNATELALLVEVGMSPMAAIVAGTSNAARAIGLERVVGSVEPGKQADLIAVAADPLGDITSLQRVAWVMQRGSVVKDQRAMTAGLPL